MLKCALIYLIMKFNREYFMKLTINGDDSSRRHKSLWQLIYCFETFKHDVRCLLQTVLFVLFWH